MPGFFKRSYGGILGLVGLRRQPEISEHAIVAVNSRLGKAFAVHGNDPLADFPCGFRNQLLEPRSQIEDPRRSDNCELVASVIRGHTENISQYDTGIRIGGSRSAARPHHRFRVFQKFHNIKAHNRRGHHAEIRKRGIPASNAGQAKENLAKLVRFGHLLHFRAWIGDRDEPVPNFLLAHLGFHALEEILLVNIRLERTPGLARHDANRSLEVYFGLNGFDLRGIRGIQNVQLGKSFDLSKRHAQNFRAQARTAHAQQKGVFKLRLFHVCGNLLQSISVRELFLRDGEPAQPIALVRAGPKRGVFLP